MNDPYPQDEAKRYRAFQYADPVPALDPDGLREKALKTRDDYVKKLRARDERVQPFVPLSEAQQRAYIAQRYGQTVPNGIGIQQGEFASIRREDFAASHQFLGTDYLLDCQAVVLVARDGAGEVLETSITHINFKIDGPGELRRMIAQLPAGSMIDATVLGGPQNDNAYLQMDLLHGLSQESRVRSIRYGFDDATTFAVDTTTGKILTSAVHETKETMNSAPELPVRLAFTPQRDNQSRFSPARMAELLYYYSGAEPTMALFESYTAQAGFTREPSIKPLFDATWQDGRVTEDELRDVASEIGRILRTPITVSVSRGGEYDFPHFEFIGKGIVVADDYINDIRKPDLPAAGTLIVPLTQLANAGGRSADSLNER